MRTTLASAPTDSDVTVGSIILLFRYKPPAWKETKMVDGASPDWDADCEPMTLPSNREK